MFAAGPLCPTLGVLHVSLYPYTDGAVSDHFNFHVILVADTENSLYPCQKAYAAAVNLGQHDHLSYPVDSAKNCHWNMAAHERLFQTALCQEALCPCLYLYKHPQWKVVSQTRSALPCVAAASSDNDLNCSLLCFTPWFP